MKNLDLDSMIDFLLECSCHREEPKTPSLYDEPITISFNNMSCSIPFNALNYITLTNALCKISTTYEEYTPKENELLFDLLAYEQLCFNLGESLDFSDPPTFYKSTFDELQEALQKKQAIEEKIVKLFKLTPKEYYTLHKKIREFI